MRLGLGHEPPGDEDEADEAAVRVRVLGRREAVLVRVEEEDVEQLVCACKGAQEDAAVVDRHAQHLVEERAELLHAVVAVALVDSERAVDLLGQCG